MTIRYESTLAKKMMIGTAVVLCSSVLYLFMLFKTSAVYEIDTSFMIADSYLSWTPTYAVSVSKTQVVHVEAGEHHGETEDSTVISSYVPDTIPGSVDSADVTPTFAGMVQWLSGLGYNDAAVAGILGNLNAESGEDFNPAASQCKKGTVPPSGSCLQAETGDGHGIVQWDGGRRLNLFNYASQSGKNWWDIELQKSFFEVEINGSEKNNGGVSVMNSFGNTKDSARRAAYQFANRFERCSGAKSKRSYEEHEQSNAIIHWDKRVGAALNYYDLIITNAY